MTSPKQRRRRRRRAEKTMEEAWAALARDEMALAQKLSRRAVDEGHVNPRLWNERGQILVRCGRTDEAEQAFRTAIALAPTYADAFARLAAVQAGRGKWVQAERLQARAVELAPSSDARAVLERYAAHVPEGPEPAPAVPDAPVFSELTERFDWSRLRLELRRHGIALLPRLLDGDGCDRLRALAHRAGACEHAIVHDSDAAGRVAVRYLRTPLAEPLPRLRAELYARLVDIANGWNEELSRPLRFPPTLAALLDVCARAGLHRPALALRAYEPGGFDPPRREPPGLVRFPLDVVVALGPAGCAVELVDERPGRKRRARAVALAPGDGVVVCARERLVDVAGVPGLQPVRRGVAPVAAEAWLLEMPFCAAGG